MKSLEVYTPKSVGELRELIKDLPADMDLGKTGWGRRLPLRISLQRRGKADVNKMVSRGGVEFLCIL
ncbi:hypothetical protein [Burkholderia vietnamiensis]|uniref:hypothetical protein n=1 Tax=Burkholderia vietnamiensis TaxID=60552 RepID=UPI001CB5D391|nr:hypothetical protein [Burkholderia vietnamiensis]CAG9229023.1 hypothetical protein BVI1335_70138 [Burkholderia vietnamiensis]